MKFIYLIQDKTIEKFAFLQSYNKKTTVEFRKTRNEVLDRITQIKLPPFMTEQIYGSHSQIKLFSWKAFKYILFSWKCACREAMR